MVGSIKISPLKCEIIFIFEGEIIAENGAISVLKANPDQTFAVNCMGEMTFQSSDSKMYPIENQNFMVAPFICSWKTLNKANPITFSFSGLLDPTPVSAFFSVSFLELTESDSIQIGNWVQLNILVKDNTWYDNFTVNTFGEHGGFNILEAHSIFKRLPALPQSGFLTHLLPNIGQKKSVEICRLYDQ
jgi:hypothetical protein